MRIGDYETESLLARGGFGAVYVGRHHRLRDRVVAIKVIEATTAARVERSIREAEALARLTHPNVVTVHDAGLADGSPYIVMELVRGSTLEQELANDAPLPRLLEVLAGAARGVAFAHERGIVHRDLKPANILVGAAGAKVCDFGIARHVDRETVLSHTGEMVGTLSYMPPEQVQTPKVGPTADVFALGAILYHALAGRPPHVGVTAMDLLLRVAENPIEPPSAVSKRPVPRALEELCLRALARDPAARPRDAGAFLEELQAARSEPRPEVVPGRRLLLPVLLLGAVAVVGVVAFLGRPGPVETIPSVKPVNGGAVKPPPTDPSPSEPVWYVTLSARSSPKPPPWFDETPPGERPTSLPLGIRFLHDPGEYLNVADGTVLVWVASAACFIGKREVTYQQFARFVARAPDAEPKHGIGLVKGAECPATWRTPEGDNQAPAGDSPVRQVDWNDAKVYCASADATLPVWESWRQAVRPSGSRGSEWDRSRRVLVLGLIEKRGSARPDGGTGGGLIPVEWCDEVDPKDSALKRVARAWIDIGIDFMSIESGGWPASSSRDDLTFRICRPGPER